MDDGDVGKGKGRWGGLLPSPKSQMLLECGRPWGYSVRMFYDSVRGFGMRS